MFTGYNDSMTDRSNPETKAMRQPANNNHATALCPPVSGIITSDDQPRGRHFRKPDPEDILFSQMPRKPRPGRHFKQTTHN